MDDRNSFGSFGTDDDRCPNCGAVKMFSALTCPTCGMDYSDTSSLKNKVSSYSEEGHSTRKDNFDPNAALAKFKSDLQKKEVDERLAEVIRQNSGMMVGERRYRIDTNTETSDNKDYESQHKKDAYYGIDRGSDDGYGMSFGGTKGSYGAGLNETLDRTVSYGELKSDTEEEPEAGYGTDLDTGFGGEEDTLVPSETDTVQEINENIANVQSIDEEKDKDDETPVVVRSADKIEKDLPLDPDPEKETEVNKSRSTDVKSRYEEYKANNDISSENYASPYSRGAFDTVPVKKKNIFLKILPLAVALIVLLVVGYGFMKYMNHDKNDKGVKYDKGRIENGYYINDWSEIKFRFDKDMHSAISNEIITQFRKRLGSSESLKQENVSFDINMFATYKNGYAVFIYTISDESFQAKLFGIDEDKFFNDNDIGKGILSTYKLLRRENDMILGDHTYRTYYMSADYGETERLNVYVCARAIGNKMVLIWLYDIPEIVDIKTIKKYFEKYSDNEE